jgi:TPR repeat protein
MPADFQDMHRQAKAGSCVAQTFLGLSDLRADDAEVHSQEAFKILSAGAKQDGSRATIGLASMCAKGLGIPGDLHEAIRLLESVAAPANGPHAFPARIELARLYSQGSGIQVDTEMASHWYESALAIATPKQTPKTFRRRSLMSLKSAPDKFNTDANEH